MDKRMALKVATGTVLISGIIGGFAAYLENETIGAISWWSFGWVVLSSAWVVLCFTVLKKKPSKELQNG